MIGRSKTNERLHDITKLGCYQYEYESVYPQRKQFKKQRYTKQIKILFTIKLKNKQQHTIGRILNSNQQIVEIEAKSIL